MSRRRTFHMRALTALAMVLLTLLATGAQAAERDHVLKGRIIRALAVDGADARRLLVGNKGSGARSAKVMESRDGGQSWQFLNGGLSLSAPATDVQAVVAVGAEVVLAGTWKHGLFASRDGGKTFKPQTGIPSTDIRDLKVAGSQGGFLGGFPGGPIVYAATARDGVFMSRDAGRTWSGLGPGPDFFWSLEVDGAGSVYAASPDEAVYRRRPSEDGWTKVFDRAKASALAASSDGKVLAVAAKDGGYLSVDAGATWRPLAVLKGENLSDVLATDIDASAFIFGSWDNGVVRVGRKDGAVSRVLKGTTVLHVARTGDTLLVGTWGDGLRLLPLASLDP